MKTNHDKIIMGLLIVFAAFTPYSLQAEVRIRVSIKAILGSGDVWPDNPGGIIGTTGVNLNSEQAVRDNIALANGLLSARGSSFRLVLRNNTVYTVADQSDPWFSIDARNATNKSDLQDVATTDKTTWKWHDDSINIYLNDTSSGWCSSPGNGDIIFVGAGAYDELIMHEIGHFLGLGHTHPNSDDGGVDDWGDGDGFSHTLNDDKDATAADIDAQYPGQTQEERNDLIFNIMSYHQPQDRFVWQQREEMIETYNDTRSNVASGRALFIRSDGDNTEDGLSVANRLETLQEAVDLSSSANDTLLIGGSTHDVANGMIISKPLTLLPWRTSVVVR